MVSLPAIPGVSWDTPDTTPDVESWLRESSGSHGVPREVLRGVLNHESSLDVASARRPDFGNGGGLAQAIESTAKQYGTSQEELRANPRKAVDFAARLLKDNAAMFGGDYQKAAAAYFVGAGNIQEAERQGGADWLAAADRIAAQYGQGTVSSYLNGAGVGGDSGGAPAGAVGNSALSTLPASAVGGLQPASRQPGYLYDLRNSGDVPVDAGLGGFTPAGQEDTALRSVDTLRARLRGLQPVDAGVVPMTPHTENTDNPLTLGLRGLVSTPGAAYGLADSGIGPLEDVKGLVRQATEPLNNIAGLPNLQIGPGGGIHDAGSATLPIGDAITQQVPTTPAGVLTTIGPGNLAKLGGLTRDIRGAEGVLSIIGKDASDPVAMYEKLRAAGHTDEAIAAAFGQQAVDLGKGAVTREAVQAAANETRGLEKVADTQKYWLGKNVDRASTRAQQLSDRMGPGIVEDAGSAPKRTGWTITNAAGDVKQVETDLPHGYQDAEQAAAGGGMKRFEQNAADQTSLNAGMRADEAGARARQVKEGIDALKAEADKLDGLAPEAQTSMIAEIAAAAKKLGDPGAELRRQVQNGGGEPDTVNAATSGDSFKDAARTERAAQAAADAREADQAAIAARTAAMAARGGGNEAVLQRAYERALKVADDAENARIAAEGGQVDQGIRAAANETKRAEPGLARAEQQATKETERQTAQAAREAEVRAVSDQQARVEARDLARRKQAWEAKQAADKALAEEHAARTGAMAEAQGYHEGGIGKEIVGLFGLPRALSLSSDIGTARDLGLFVGTKEGRQAIARGGAAGLQSVIHSDEDARLVISEAEKGSRWFGFASDAKNLPGERPLHGYDFGAGASSASRVPEMASLNESKISQAIEKVHPGIKFSDRALAVQRNVAGIDLMESRLNEIALKYGVSGPQDAVQNARFLSEAQSTIDSVNHLRGYSGGSKAKALGALNALTSPQQLISRLQVLGDPLNFALRGDMESAKFAASSLAGFATSQGALLALARATGGTGRWSANLDPTSGDFGTIRVGNTRYDTMAGLGPTMRLVAKIGAEGSDQVFNTDYAKNQAAVGVLAQRWLENKEQPVSRVVTDFMLHNKLPDEQTAINMLAPSIATGFMQNLAEERGANKALAVPNAALNFAGIGTNTYQTTDDQKAQIAKDRGLGDYGSLDPVQRLKVLAALPQDAGKNAATPERQAYEDSAKKAGYLPPPKDADGNPLKETNSEKSKRETTNADVLKSNPDLDVQRWFYGSKDGGSLSSKDAVSKALELGLTDRKVHFAGNDRNLAATPDDAKFWQKYGGTVNQVEHEITNDTKNLDAFAQHNYQKPYFNLTAEQQSSVKTAILAGAKQNPKVEAVMIFAGQEKPNADGQYNASSPAVIDELKKLWAEFPGAQSLPLKETARGKKTTLTMPRR